MTFNCKFFSETAGKILVMNKMSDLQEIEKNLEEFSACLSSVDIWIDECRYTYLSLHGRELSKSVNNLYMREKVSLLHKICELRGYGEFACYTKCDIYKNLVKVGTEEAKRLLAAIEIGGSYDDISQYIYKDTTYYIFIND